VKNEMGILLRIRWAIVQIMEKEEQAKEDEDNDSLSR
jgi:hypothetical protein